VDQWWVWSGNSVTVYSDPAGAGRPDPSTAVTLGASEKGENSGPAVFDAGTPVDAQVSDSLVESGSDVVEASQP
jgi:hypothetical protein